MVFKVVCTGVIGVVCAIIVKQYKPDVAICINIATGVIIFCLVASYIKDLILGFLNISSESNLPSEIIIVLFKIIGIGYLVEFASDIADDSGNSSISNKILFGGKIIIAYLSFPIIFDLFKLLIEML